MRRVGGESAKHLDGIVAVELAFEAGVVEQRAHPAADERYRLQIRFERIQGERLEGRLGTKYPRRPVQLGVQAAQRPEQRATQRQRQPAAQLFLVEVPAVAPIAGEVLVTRITRQ